MRKVFVSYSQDSDEHRARVRALADRLNRDGFDCTIDQHAPHPSEPWPLWMTRQIEAADFVLVVCSERYFARATGEEQPGIGLGATFESSLILQSLYERGIRNEKFIAVFFRDEEERFVPIWLRRYTWYRLDEQYDQFRAYLEGSTEEAKAGDAPDPPPIPRYPNDEVRALAVALDEAHLREETIVSEGGDPAAVRREILDLRRRIREGGNVKAGDLLAGRFKLIELLGHGGFANVWKAYDKSKRNLVAVKVLHPQSARDDSRLDRFFRGARKMAELHHQGIVRVIEERLDDGGFHFFVMEYVEGGDLRAAVLANRLPAERIVPLLAQAAEALQFAHDRGVIHRDIKPANILLGTDGRPKLTDFDLVRAADTTGGTLGGGMLGTFLYSAPECMSTPQEAGAVSDVYSLAMTAAFCFHGKDLTLDVLRRPDAFLDRLPCPPGVRAALRKGASWEVAERFKTVRALAEAIEKGLTEPVQAKKPSPIARSPTPKSPVPKATDPLLLYLGQQVANLPEADRAGAVLDRIERAMPFGAEDLKTLGMVAWALDYFPGRSARAGGRDAAVALRERAFAPLRQRRPSPPLPDRDDLAWAAIPGGSFRMGSPAGNGFDDERPTHQVAISPFRLGIYTVTAAEYARLTGQSNKADNLPATGVDWYSAYAYAAWLGGRLPTEAEWEYAARGGTKFEYTDRHGEETTLDKVGWYAGNARQKPEPVGQLEPNPWGLHEMIGNVWEWVADWHALYSSELQTDPWGPPSGARRVVRGGSVWFVAVRPRAAYRYIRDPGIEDGNQGFRVALPAAVPELAGSATSARD